MSHATHSNAALTPRARLRLARLIVDHDWTPARAAERYDVSWKTAAKWADRYRFEGSAGMLDRSSKPRRQPNRTPAPVVRKIIHLRWKQRLGPVEIGDRLAMPSSTIHAVLVRCRVNRLTHIDRATGEPIRRYEHEKPGDMIHVDVKKLGKVPDGGGWRYVYRSNLWAQTCADLEITPKKTRPYRPQTNGKIERFHRTLAEGWAFKKFYNSESARLAALPSWIHEYNHHRPHSAVGKKAPITRLDNLPGHHS